MQKGLIELLEKNGIKVQRVEMNDEEMQLQEIYHIEDPERMIFVVELKGIRKDIMEKCVNRLVEWITYEQTNIEKDLIDTYNKRSTMRMILWDLYIIFINRISENNPKLLDEEIYPIQRDTRFMKRYIVQGATDEKMAEQISFIVKPEQIMDDFINKLDYESNEVEYCKQMCQKKNGEAFGYGLKGETYQEIIKVLKEINKDNFGEDTNENTGN